MLIQSQSKERMSFSVGELYAPKTVVVLHTLNADNSTTPNWFPSGMFFMYLGMITYTNNYGSESTRALFLNLHAMTRVLLHLKKNTRIERHWKLVSGV